MICTVGALSVMIAECITLPSIGGSQSTRSAEQLADQMLTAIGGRSTWANLSNTVNESQQNRLAEPTVVRAVITMDFTRPRFRIETTGPDLHLVRVIDGERHWRLNRQGIIESVPAAAVLADQEWYAGHVYRTLHRIAARDPALSLAVGDKNRLEVYEDSARIAWFAVDARGEPYAFGAHDDDVGSITGPWDFIQDGIRHPVWVARPDGSWRANVTALRINIRLTESMFARPDSAR